ncbi:MAG: rod-binding protein [Calditerrivibrio sp.]|nr:rod-binding protein [Calditerrivibrio sp.]MCA1933005.1 rod-binding protein [Calditerrivibrio sp.]MCA1980073.1 rod-binding protein [Calditerrivibrio sp.]
METKLVQNSGKNFMNIDRDKQLKKACEDFEALFYDMVFKSARKTVQEGGLIKRSFGEEIFTEMLDSKMSEEIAKRSSNGLKDLLYKQLKGLNNHVIKNYEHLNMGKNSHNILA